MNFNLKAIYLEKRIFIYFQKIDIKERLLLTIFKLIQTYIEIRITI